MEFSLGFNWCIAWHIGACVFLVGLSPCHFHSGGEKYTAKKLFSLSLELSDTIFHTYFYKESIFADLLKFALLVILMMMLRNLKFQTIDH